MSYPGTGSVSQTLQITSGRAKWQDVVAGGVGGIGVTVAGLPVSADFETMAAAISGNNTILNVIGDTTEPLDVLVTASGLTVRIFNDAEINLQTNSFLWSAPGNVAIRGQGSLRYAIAGGSNTVFDLQSNAGILTVDGLELKNESTGGGLVTITNGTDGRFDKCVWTGDVRIAGERNIISACNMTTTLIIESGSINTHISDTQIDGGFTDFGSGTLMGDINLY
jgi:hypothetical protein